MGQACACRSEPTAHGSGEWPGVREVREVLLVETFSPLVRAVLFFMA